MRDGNTLIQAGRLEFRSEDRKDREKLAFKNGCKLVIDRRGIEESISLIGKSGNIEVTIEMTEKGSLIKFSGAQIQLRAKEKIEINSPNVEINAEKRIDIQTNGDFHQRIQGDFHQRIQGDAFRAARVQNIHADLGDVKIKANDDLRLDGERIKLNCAE